MVDGENLRQSDHSMKSCWPIRAGHEGEEPQLSHAGPGEQFRSWKCLPASEGRSESKHGQSQELRHNGNCLTSVRFPPQPLSPWPDPQLSILGDYCFGWDKSNKINRNFYLNEWRRLKRIFEKNIGILVKESRLQNLALLLNGAKLSLEDSSSCKDGDWLNIWGQASLGPELIWWTICCSWNLIKIPSRLTGGIFGVVTFQSVATKHKNCRHTT